MLENELKVGRQAVLQAMRLSRTVQKELAREDCITKKDKSPVTIADFTAQAIICKILTDRFPNIPIVGEERSDALKKPEHQEILDKIIHYIEHDGKISEILDSDNLFQGIDPGGGESTNQTFWTLDPQQDCVKVEFLRYGRPLLRSPGTSKFSSLLFFLHML